jgi:hypothetical protein
MTTTRLKTRWEVVLASGFVTVPPPGKSGNSRSDSDSVPGFPAHWVSRSR